MMYLRVFTFRETISRPLCFKSQKAPPHFSTVSPCALLLWQCASGAVLYVVIPNYLLLSHLCVSYSIPNGIIWRPGY